ncbi:hypothetical protein WI665_12050 [Vibrio cholerae]
MLIASQATVAAEERLAMDMLTRPRWRSVLLAKWAGIETEHRARGGERDAVSFPPKNRSTLCIAFDLAGIAAAHIFQVGSSSMRVLN